MRSTSRASSTNDSNERHDTCGALLGGRATYPIVLYGDCYEPVDLGPGTRREALGEAFAALLGVAARPLRWRSQAARPVVMPERGLSSRAPRPRRRARVQALEAGLGADLLRSGGAGDGAANEGAARF